MTVPASRRLSLLLTSAANPYLVKVKAEAEAAAREEGYSLECTFAENEPVTQIQQIHAALRRPPEERPEALLVMPVHDDAVRKLTREAVRSGVAWIALFRRLDYLDELRREFPRTVVSAVMPDHTAIGELQARQFLALMPNGGKLLYVHGTTGNASTGERIAALEASLSGTPVDIVDKVDGRWTGRDAEAAAARSLRLAIARHGRIDAIGCQSDAMAEGVLRAVADVATALDRPDLRDVPVTGCDGLADVGRRMVDDGRLAATIVLPPPGRPAVELFVRGLRTRVWPGEVRLVPSAYPQDNRRWTPSTGPLSGPGSLRLRQRRAGVIVHGDAGGLGAKPPVVAAPPAGAR